VDYAGRPENSQANPKEYKKAYEDLRNRRSGVIRTKIPNETRKAAYAILENFDTKYQTANSIVKVRMRDNIIKELVTRYSQLFFAYGEAPVKPPIIRSRAAQ
jgi:hypothetical protein